jgi:hypothetical protein
LEEEAVPWDSLLLGKSILTIFSNSGLGGVFGQTSLDVGFEFLSELFSSDPVIIPSTNGFRT